MPKIFVLDPSNPVPEAEWRDYHGLELLLAPLLVTDLRRIRKEVADLKLDEVEGANELDRHMADHIIRDWRGPVTPDRQKLPLTRSNKFHLVNALPGLKNWLLPESDRIAESRITQLEDELGNSGGSPAGRPSAPAEATGGF